MAVNSSDSHSLLILIEFQHTPSIVDIFRSPGQLTSTYLTVGDIRAEGSTGIQKSK